MNRKAFRVLTIVLLAWGTGAYKNTQALLSGEGRDRGLRAVNSSRCSQMLVSGWGGLYSDHNWVRVSGWFDMFVG